MTQSCGSCMQDPENLFTLRGLEDTCRDQGLLDETLIFWERYNRDRPGDIFLLTRIADGDKTIDNLESAEEYYQRALRIDSRDSYTS